MDHYVLSMFLVDHFKCFKRKKKKIKSQKLATWL